MFNELPLSNGLELFNELPLPNERPLARERPLTPLAVPAKGQGREAWAMAAKVGQFQLIEQFELIEQFDFINAPFTNTF